VAAEALPEDPDGLGRWRAGDFVLANDRVAVLISDVGPGELYDPYGGRLVGVTRVEDGALVEPADYGLLLFGLGRFLVGTDAVGVREDGSDGGPAVIRARGPLAPLEALADLLDGLLPEDFEGLPAALDYELAPDRDVVDVYLSVRPDESGVRARLGVVQVFFQANRMPAWAPGVGFGERDEASAYFAFEDGRATSWAWMAPEGTLDPLFAASGADVFTSSRVTLGPCEEGRIHLGRMAIGGPGLPALQGVLAQLEDAPRSRLRGELRNADGSPAPDARVHVTTDDGQHLTRFWPGDDGAFDVEVDPGATRLFAFRAGEPLVGPVTIADGETVVTMPATGRVEVTVTDPHGGPLPSRVEVLPAEGEAPSAPPAFGEPVPGDGRSHVAFPTDGRATVRVPPGRHRVRVSRGPEYERFETEVRVAADETVALAPSLTRVVDTTGVMCADYHIHTHRSVDSPDAGALKVAGLVADGLEIPVRSEHEFVNDFGPVVESLGLGDWAFGMAGLELTTFTYGHFGVFPLEPQPQRAGLGAIDWHGRLAPEVFDAVRARDEMPALIVNHPRSGGLRQGYFTVAGYDPETGAVARPELWDEELSVIEVFNDSDFESNRDGTVRDWFSLLRGGRRVVAVGSSDSHRILGAPVGYPRTCLRLGTDDPRALTADRVREVTVAGRSHVSGGIYLEAVGPEGASFGDEARGVGEVATFDVVVRAAEWVDVNRLEVIVDGVTTETIALRPDDVDPLEPTVRARATVEVEVAPEGSFVVFHAAGDERLAVGGGRPFAVGNPIFLRR
ncbi:MAG TPA: CehA/McbA family metallohydrolase, partial [Sandaracinaceae bacterium LLY-WYZ-13_1]|nr:CehA/McbA family metallohydrolase [Sandaracinaceae bacterium LLY-WYZ-13_1]